MKRNVSPVVNAIVSVPDKPHSRSAWSPPSVTVTEKSP